jgi:dCMP deaminase
MRKSWQIYFMELAEQVASRSKDPSTKVGCVITSEDKVVVSTGYNGIPSGVDDLEERMQRPAKYMWTSHAEENAVAQAARIGARLKGGTAYSTNVPCARCARMLIQAGVTSVWCYGNDTKMDPDEFAIAQEMFTEAGVELIIMEKETV